MEESEKSKIGNPIECPVCGNTEISQLQLPGLGYQCQRCNHKFPGPVEPPHEEHDYDFPSPEDHELQ